MARFIVEASGDCWVIPTPDEQRYAAKSLDETGIRLPVPAEIAAIYQKYGAHPPDIRPRSLPRQTRAYFIYDRTNNAIKIGRTRQDPADRLRSLQTGHPGNLELVGWVEEGYVSEEELHRRFADLRIRGEWFCLAGELAAYLDRWGWSPRLGAMVPGRQPPNS